MILTVKRGLVPINIESHGWYVGADMVKVWEYDVITGIQTVYPIKSDGNYEEGLLACMIDQFPVSLVSFDRELEKWTGMTRSDIVKAIEWKEPQP